VRYLPGKVLGIEGYALRETLEVELGIPVRCVNDGEAAVQAAIGFLRPLPGLRRVDLLAYHKGGQEKYRALGQEACFRIFAPPAAPRLEAVRLAFTEAGFDVTLGG